MKYPVSNWFKNRLKLFQNKKKVAPSPFMRVSYCSPRQVVLLTARQNDAENIWPIDWHMPVSIDPELYAVSLNPGYGEELIRASGSFVVNFVPASWEQIIFYCGKTSGQREDKFFETKLQKKEAQMVNAPCLSEALGILECKVIQDITVGDHFLFIAEVLHATLQLDAPRLHHIDVSLSEIADSFE